MDAIKRSFNEFPDNFNVFKTLFLKEFLTWAFNIILHSLLTPPFPNTTHLLVCEVLEFKGG